MLLGLRRNVCLTCDGLMCVQEKDDYEHTVQKLQHILEERRQHYAFSDLHVPLEGEGQDSHFGAPAAVVAYR